MQPLSFFSDSLRFTTDQDSTSGFKSTEPNHCGAIRDPDLNSDQASLSHKSSILPFISFLCVFKNADPDVPVHYRINADPDDDPESVPDQGFDDQN